MEKGKQKRSMIVWALRILGTVLFLWLTFRSLDVREFFQQIQSLPFISYFLLFLLFLFNQLLTAWRWKTLLNMTGIRAPLWGLTVAVLYGQTINKILPSSIGGDSARIAYLFKAHPDQKTRALSATLMDRFLSFVGLFLLGALSLPFGMAFPAAQRWLAEGALFLIFGVIAAVYWGYLDQVVTAVMEWKHLPEKAAEIISRLWKVFLVFREQKPAVLGAVGISLLRQGLMVLNLFLLLRLLGVSVTLVDMYLVVPVVTILVILPISIGGIGVREAAWVSILGISREAVLSFTLIRYSFVILLPLLLLLEPLLFAGKKVEEITLS